MRTNRRLLSLATLLVAGLVASCDTPTTPPTTGRLMPRVVFVRDDGNPYAVQTVTAMTAYVSAPNFVTRVVPMPPSGGSFTGQATDLPAGTYSITVVGFIGTGGAFVQNFGTQNGVVLAAGATKNQTVPVSVIVPTVTAPAVADSNNFAQQITFTTIPAATGYEYELSQSSTFAGELPRPIAGASPTITVDQVGTWFFRSRPILPTLPSQSSPAAWSDVLTFSIKTSATGRDVTTPSTPSLVSGTPVTYNDQNITPGEQDAWYRFAAQAGDTLIAEVFAARLTPASPLRSALTILRANGTTPVGSDDPGTADPRVVAVAPATENYFVKVTRSGTGTTVGHYRLVMELRRLPGLPTNFTAIAASGSSVSLGWTDIADETSYRVERCTGAGCLNFTEIGSTAQDAQTYSDTVTLTLAYRYRIRARNAIGNSAFVGPLDVVVSGPTAPTGLTATTVSGSRIDLAWNDASNNETGFEIQHCTGVGCTPNLGTIPTQVPNTSAYQHTVTVDQTYGYRIRSTNNVGQSAYSPIVYANTLRPLAPTTLTATTISATQINLAWADNSNNETRFQIERCSGQGCNSGYALIDSVAPNVQAYNDVSALASTYYGYRVRAINIAGGSAYTNAVAADTRAPGAPAGFAATIISATQVNLNWSDTTAAETGFVIERCTGAACSGFAQLGTTLSAGTTALVDNSVVAGNSYRYRIRALGVAGNSPDAGPVLVDVLLPGAPTVLVGIPVSGTQINLGWLDGSNNETLFRIERCLGIACSNFLPIDSVTAGTQAYSDVGVVVENDYRYRVRAQNAVGASAYTNIAPASTRSAAAPSALTAGATSATNIHLAWADNAANEVGFRVMRCNGSACTNYAEIANVGPNVQSYENTVGAGQTFRYVILAYNAVGNSSPSNAAAASTTLPPVPTGLAAVVASPTSVRVNWTDGLFETGYLLERCDGAGCSGGFTAVDSAAMDSTSFTDNGLVYGNTYGYQLRATNVIGASAATAIVYVQVQAPGPVASLTAATVSGSHIDVTWSDTTANETGFIILRCAGLACVPATAIDTVAANTTSFSDLSVAIDETYRYIVVAQNLAGDTPSTTTVEANTIRPSAPLSLFATAASGSSVELDWTDNSANELGFIIARCTGAGCSNFTDIDTVGVDVTTFLDNTVVAGSTYSYRLFSYNLAGPSAGAAGPATVDLLVPTAPTNLTATTFSDTRIDLAWTDNSSDESAFEIDRCQGAGCSNFGNTLTLVAGTTSFPVTGLTPSVEYTFRVRAINAVGGSSYTNSASASTNLPAAPSALTAIITTTNPVPTILLSWTDNANVPNGETGFVVESCLGDGCTNFADLSTTTADSTVLITTGALGTIVRHRVRALNAVGSSGYSNEVTTTLLTPVAPGVLLASGISTTSVSLQWSDDSDNETQWHIERCTGGGCNGFTPLVTLSTPDSTTYVDATVVAGQTYRYRVSASNPIGTSAYSPVADANTILPPAPTGLFASATSSSAIAVSWTDNAPDELSYRVERCLGVGCTDFVEVAQLALNSTSHTSTGLTFLETYRFRVRAVNTVGFGAYSTIVEASPDVPKDPANLAALAMSATSIRLDWADSSSNETGFSIERCQLANCSTFATVTQVGPNVVTFTNNALTAGQSYSYRVKALKLGSASSGPSNVASAVTSAPAAPTNLAAETVTGSRVDLTWDENATNELQVQLDRCTGAACVDFLLLQGLAPNTGTFSDTTVALNVEYRYRVRATNNVGASAYSNIATSNTLQPASASGLAATTISASQINLSWTDLAANENYYVIERCTGLACTDFVRLDSLAPNTSAFQDLTVVPQTVYRYRVAPFNNSGTTGYDGPAQATTLTPVTPTGLSANVLTGTHIDLSWTDAADNEDGYRIERCTGDSCTPVSSFVELGVLPAGSQAFADLTALQSNYYAYRIRAFNAAGVSTYSALFFTNTFLPNDPSALTATTVFADRVDLTWADNATNETGFEVERCTGVACTNFAALATVAANVLAYSDATTSINNTYFYRLRAMNGVGGSGYTDSVTVNTNTIPADPTALTATTASSTSIQLNWTDNSNNETGFAVLRCAGVGCTPTVQVATAAVNSGLYVDAGLSTETSYSYRVRAFNAASSGPSNVATATTILPLAPTALAATSLSDVRVDLTWDDNAVNEDGFTIERCSGASCSNFTALTTLPPNSTGYSDLTLTPNQTVSYRVRAYNGAGTSAFTNTATASTDVPGIPTALTATTITATRIDLAWTDNANSEARFRIERCEGISCTNFVPVDSVLADVTAYSDLGLNSGTFYRYRVRAVNAGGSGSGYTNIATAGTRAPLDPTLLTATTFSATRIDLTWMDNADDESAYLVERCTLGGCPTFAVIDSLPANTTAYQDVSATLGNDYTYRVRARNNAGSSNFTTDVNANTRVPAVPANVAANTISATRIDITWDDVADNEDTYRVERCVGAGCSIFVEIAILPAGTTVYTDDGLTPSESYSYQVRGVNVSGSSAYSAPTTATTSFPADPTGLSAFTTAPTSIHLSWNDNADNELEFAILRCDNAGCGTDSYVEIDQVGVNVTTYDDASVTLGNSYGYRVVARNAAGTSGHSDASATTLLPGAPSSLTTLLQSSTQVDLSWTDNADNESATEIQRCSGAACSSFLTIATLPSGTTFYSDAAAPSGTVLVYRVRVTNNAGPSAYSNEAQDGTIGPDVDPSGLVATTLSESQVHVAWSDNSSNETHFHIERCTGASCSSFAEVAVVDGNTTSTVIAGLDIGNIYGFRVRASNVVGASGYTNETSANTSLPDAPSSLTATTVSGGEIGLSWTDNGDLETTYRIERCSGGGCGSFVEIDRVGADVTAYSDFSVALNAVYRYRVRALNAVGASNYTNEDQANTLLPSSPQNLVATSVSGQRIDLSWQDSNLENSYEIEACDLNSCSLAVIASPGQNQTSLVLAPLTFGTNYLFRMRALNIAGYSAYSNDAQGSTVLNEPTGIQAMTQSRTGIQLTWQDNSGIETGYAVERCNGLNCVDFNPIAILGANTTSFLNDPAPVGTTFMYKIRALTNGGTTQSGETARAMTPVPVNTSPVLTPSFDDVYSSLRYMVINVPAGTRQLVVKQVAGSGDPDMYVRYGSVPTAYQPLNDALNCTPYTGSPVETCVMNNPAPGDWYIMTHGYSNYSSTTVDVFIPGDVVVVQDLNLFYSYMSISYPANRTFGLNLMNTGSLSVRSQVGSAMVVDRGHGSPGASLLLTEFGNLMNSAGYGFGYWNNAAGGLPVIPLGFKSLMLWMPTQAYTQPEIDNLRAFLREGGRLVLVGEYEGFLTAPGIATQNQIFSFLGSGTSFRGSPYPNGLTYLSGTGFVVGGDQLTNGVGGTITFGAGGSMYLNGAFDHALFTDNFGLPFGGVVYPGWNW